MPRIQNGRLNTEETHLLRQVDSLIFMQNLPIWLAKIVNSHLARTDHMVGVAFKNSWSLAQKADYMRCMLAQDMASAGLS